MSDRWPSRAFAGRLTTADGRIVHNAGGSEAQELAFVLAVAVAYLRALEGAGVALDAARDMIGFTLAADADQFLTVAKFRALRKLWARVEQACGLAPKPAFVSAETAWRMMTRRDPWVNMLRTTIAAFSAGIGGADALSVLPFTAALGLPDRFARRIARNTQLVLLEESNLAKVADPAAGSGGIEDLTDKLCRAAWALFQEIEAAGGAPAALEPGLIQDKIAKVRAEREKRGRAPQGHADGHQRLRAAVGGAGRGARCEAGRDPAARGRDPLSRADAVPPRRAVRAVARRLRPHAGGNRRAAKGVSRQSRHAGRFHRARDLRQEFLRGRRHRGGGQRRLRSRDEMIAAFKASGAKLACLCSSDEVYEREAADAAKALAAAGARIVVLAGRPRRADALEAAGVGILASCYAGVAMRSPALAGGGIPPDCQLAAAKPQTGRDRTQRHLHDRNSFMTNPNKPLGWRKRIGVLSPTVMETACHDFFRMAPDGVSICSITSNVEHWNKENFKQAVIDPLVTLSKYLASRNVDYIMHCGMPVVTTRGKGFEEEIVKIITDATGLPASTSIRSAIRALAHLGIRNVVVVSPYPQELHQSALTFLKASGFNIAAEHTEDVVFKRLQDVTPAHIAATAKRVLAAAPTADGIYIPCNQWAAADAGAADRERMRRAGGERRACRPLGGVPRVGHQRSARGQRPVDGQPARCAAGDWRARA